MSEKPIIFNGEMARAVLDGRKMMTRRVVKPQPDESLWKPWVVPEARAYLQTDEYGKVLSTHGLYHQSRHSSELALMRWKCPYGLAGDKLWVKENWAQRKDLDHLNGTQLYEAGVREAWYWADGPARCSNTGCNGAAGRVRAARFMPRWASRITLEITGIRVERVKEISHEDAVAEGFYRIAPCDNYPHGNMWGRAGFAALWDSINAKRGYGWDVNPWVWVIEFRRIEP